MSRLFIPLPVRHWVECGNEISPDSGSLPEFLPKYSLISSVKSWYQLNKVPITHDQLIFFRQALKISLRLRLASKVSVSL